MNVSLPLRWQDLKLEKAPSFRTADYADWKPRLKSDPWKGFFEVKQKLNLNN
jgi:bifunctional non-homologous end joining protein LigD